MKFFPRPRLTSASVTAPLCIASDRISATIVSDAPWMFLFLTPSELHVRSWAPMLIMPPTAPLASWNSLERMFVYLPLPTDPMLPLDRMPPTASSDLAAATLAPPPMSYPVIRFTSSFTIGAPMDDVAWSLNQPMTSCMSGLASARIAPKKLLSPNRFWMFCCLLFAAAPDVAANTPPFRSAMEVENDDSPVSLKLRAVLNTGVGTPPYPGRISPRLATLSRACRPNIPRGPKKLDGCLDREPIPAVVNMPPVPPGALYGRRRFRSCEDERKSSKSSRVNVFAITVAFYPRLCSSKDRQASPA